MQPTKFMAQKVAERKAQLEAMRKTSQYLIARAVRIAIMEARHGRVQR